MRTFAPDELTEIRDSYRNAANPKKQIGILSDLYDCAEQDIQQALGLPVTPAKPKPSTGRKQKRAYVQWQKDQVAQLCELYEKGYKLVDIADMLGIPLERVKKKVFNMGTAGQLTLRSHRQKSKPQKVPTEQNRQEKQRETQLVTASGAEERSSDVHVLLQDYFSRIGEPSTADDCNFPSVPHALSELDQLLTRAAALVHALRVLAEKGGGAP
nr:hypothetical protein [uncultured Agathobaculum sp.]